MFNLVYAMTKLKIQFRYWGQTTILVYGRWWVAINNLKVWSSVNFHSINDSKLS